MERRSDGGIDAAVVHVLDQDAPAPTGKADPALLHEVIELARYAPEDLYSLVQHRAADANTVDRAAARVTRQLAAIADQLAAIQVAPPDADQPLQRIINTATVLVQRLGNEPHGSITSRTSSTARA